MQPTRQDLIPFTFGITTVSAGFQTFDLNSAYDHVVTCVAGEISGTAGAAITARLQNDANETIAGWSAVIQTTGFAAFTVMMWVVMQQRSAITISTNATLAGVSISGYRLNPPGATLLP